MFLRGKICIFIQVNKKELCVDCCVVYLQLEHIDYDSLNKNPLGAIWCGTWEFGPVVLYPDISPSNNNKKIIKMHLFTLNVILFLQFCIFQES